MEKKRHKVVRKLEDTERTCLATGENKPVSEMIRFVLSPDGMPVPDVAQKLPGRGMWVTATREAVEQVVKKNSFARAAKQNVKPPRDLAGQTETALEERAVQLLSLARKSGMMVVGFEKVKSALAAGKVALLLHAKQASTHGVQKIGGMDVPVMQCISREALEKLTNQENATHVALMASGITRECAGALARWTGFNNQTRL